MINECSEGDESGAAATAAEQTSVQACKQVQPSHCLPGRKGRKDGRANGAEEEGRREVAFHGTYEWQRRRSIGRSAMQRAAKKGRTNKTCLSVCQSLSSPTPRHRHLTCFASATDDRIKPPKGGKPGDGFYALSMPCK